MNAAQKYSTRPKKTNNAYTWSHTYSYNIISATKVHIVESIKYIKIQWESNNLFPQLKPTSQAISMTHIFGNFQQSLH